MKKILFVFLISVLSGVSFAQTTLKTVEDSASYAFGMLVGTNLSRQLPQGLNVDMIMQAMSTALKGQKTLMEPQAANEVYTRYNQTAQKKSGGSKQNGRPEIPGRK